MFIEKTVSGLSYSEKEAMTKNLVSRGFFTYAVMENPALGMFDSTYTVEWKEWD